MVKIETNHPKPENVPHIKVKTGLRAGRWSCRDCQGQVSGSTMTQAKCGTCQDVP